MTQTPQQRRRGLTDEQWLDLNPQWQIAFDQHQWILRKRNLGGWTSHAFCGTKAGLMTSVIRHCGRHISKEARQELLGLPDSHAYWYGMRLRKQDVMRLDQPDDDEAAASTD